MNDNRIWIIISAVSGFTAVALGAFGAHGLKEQLPENLLEVYKTGVFYHLVHSVVLLILSLLHNFRFRFSRIFILLGIILFSFSLYIYSVTATTTFAMITPVGGLSFLIGWIMIGVEGFKSFPKS